MEPSDGAVTSPIPVRCRILYLRTPRSESLDALGSEASVIADLEGSQPVLPTPVLTLSTLFAQGPKAAAWLKSLEAAPATESMEIAARSSFVPVGASSRLSVQTFELVEDPRDWLDEFRDRGPIPREVAVIVTATNHGPRVALSVTDLDPERETRLREAFLEDPSISATPPPPAQDEVLRREVLNIGRYPEIDSPLVLHLDSPFSEGNGAALAMVVETLRPDQVEGSNEAEALAELAEAAAALAANQSPLTEETRHKIERTEALDVFQLRGGRSALLQVAVESDATLTQELALVADAEVLQALGERAFPTAEAGSTPVPAGEPTREVPIGWRLDSAAWNLLAERALSETLDPELMGVFYRRAGAVAAFPDIIQDALKAARGERAKFDERLMTEQRYFLEDPSPSARLRAYDWLREYGVELADYDPLGERKERQAALEKAAEASASQGGNQ
ncbi:hypothetical protein Poly30_23210 [Planctomycetes bacterium Poly30]|uniref:Uncharacterized protein n=2 Tax=Saltatorellus ferox TaxID=2528018 RepID=A0A518ERU3_9BACT|nr:hypothetical protein Poly30_23210 [Planctomycetes bacterium Poly30]